MVWAGVTSTTKIPVIFVVPGVKINAQQDLNEILVKKVLFWSHSHFNRRSWTFQQDSAPTRCAKVVQQWCGANFPTMITSTEWPPYSPDLNSLDFSVWSVLESKVCAKLHNNLDSLKLGLQKVRNKIVDDYHSVMVGALPKRLKSCMKFK
ncbi:hypothetical protein FHG87_018822 [Trinorchestia longiramus]|nr:hypothetical protein FHG87_018822 [Trinorchestia longiramus]